MTTPRHRRPPFALVERHGFTILELLIVIVIVGLTFGIVAPRFRLSERTAVELAGMQLAQDIDVTRTRALSTRQRARVAFDEIEPRYGGYLDHDGDGVIAQSAVEWQALRGFGERELPRGVRFGRGVAPAIPDDGGSGAVTFTDGRVEFDSRGLVSPMGSGGVVYLVTPTDPSAVVAVSVAPSGNTRLWTWRGTEGWQ
jgi:prepilin-type N-terminal cleavage/methylation domain-containing protein